jgi:hypothetical protein
MRGISFCCEDYSTVVPKGWVVLRKSQTDRRRVFCYSELRAMIFSSILRTALDKYALRYATYFLARCLKKICPVLSNQAIKR